MPPLFPSVPNAYGDLCRPEHFAEIPSTNDHLLALARAGAPSGTIISADYQSAGRGRHGAVWSAPPGAAVLCSMLFRTPSRWPAHHLAILTGVGVANGLRALDFPVKIKWPNDLMLDERKVSGILVETVDEAVVVGFGINCHIAEDAFPEAIRARAGSLHTFTDQPVSRDSVMLTVCTQLADAFARVRDGGIIKVLREWNSMNWYSRRKVRVTGPLGAVEGDGLFLDGHRVLFHVFKDSGVIAMPLSSTVEAR